MRLVTLAEWDEKKAYNEDSPNYIHYSIEWKVRINKRQVSKGHGAESSPYAQWTLAVVPTANIAGPTEQEGKM